MREGKSRLWRNAAFAHDWRHCSIPPTLPLLFWHNERPTLSWNYNHSTIFRALIYKIDCILILLFDFKMYCQEIYIFYTYGCLIESNIWLQFFFNTRIIFFLCLLLEITYFIYPNSPAFVRWGVHCYFNMICDL